MNIAVKLRNNEMLKNNAISIKQILSIPLTAVSQTSRIDTVTQSTLNSYLLIKWIEVNWQQEWTGGHRFEIYFGDKSDGISWPIYVDRKGEESRLTPGFQGWMSRCIERGITCSALPIPQRCVPGPQVDLAFPTTITTEPLHFLRVLSTDRGSA